MSVWRYTAIPLEGGSDRRRGEMAGATAAEVRAALRRIGLQVIDLRPLRGHARPDARRGGWRASAAAASQRHVRGRRRQMRAELYDSLATMLDAGLPLLEAVDTVIDSTRRRRSPLRSMLLQMREDLRSGSSMGESMERHRTWFDVTEVAMVRAGQHGGTLSEVLRALAHRHESSDELSNRLIGALAYPTIVAMVGLGVVIFLSVKPLPDLVQILVDSDVQVPPLTAAVMAVGQGLAHHGWMLVLCGAGVLVAAVVAREIATRRGSNLARWAGMLTPRVFRRIAVARVALRLAELVRTGVPLVEALRVLGPTTGPALHQRLLAAADRAERGEELSAALDDERWFDAEFRRLLDVGQTSGELDDLLERIGQRYSRRASRLIDRLAALLEPTVILGLAFLVGLVVMATLLPLMRLREVL